MSGDVGPARGLLTLRATRAQIVRVATPEGIRPVLMLLNDFAEAVFPLDGPDAVGALIASLQEFSGPRLEVARDLPGGP